MARDVEQRGPGFFAEVRGIGLADVATTDAAYRAVRAAFEEHSVLLFRNQSITNELQVAYSRGKIAPHLASGRERESLPAVRWRIRWRNPTNGRDSLYIASHTCGIDGIPKDEALVLIEQLIEFATAPGHTYLHRWQPGDVIMWDNRATLHRGRPWPDDQPRHMIRTTISATDADGLAAMWPARTAL